MKIKWQWSGFGGDEGGKGRKEISQINIRVVSGG
jgi:hypothetical protein